MLLCLHKTPYWSNKEINGPQHSGKNDCRDSQAERIKRRREMGRSKERSGASHTATQQATEVKEMKRYTELENGKSPEAKVKQMLVKS